MIAGRYRLDRVIGRGGSGTVHLAHDEVLGRPVAMKRIGMIPGADSAEIERAAREARLAAALNHPHVVSVFDLVDEDGVRWLVMEYVDGETLSERVRSTGPLDATTAATLLGQTADALVEAHGNGIVHRDVKPSNILISHGLAKLNDFGIARSADDESLTQTGLVTGSPAYLAPEVASGSSATPASDVWSLGATLYHAVSGRPPYDVGDNLIGALYKIVHEDPPRLPDVHPMAGLVSVMMKRDIEQRWSMSQVRDELARMARGHDSTVAAPPVVLRSPDPTGVLPAVSTARVPPPPPSPRPRRGAVGWGLLAAVAVVAIASVALAYVWAGRGTPEALPDETPGSSQTAETPDSTAPAPASVEKTREEIKEEMDTFITSYIATVTSDPAAAFEQLTPEFKRASGGYEGYIGYWGTVRSAEVLEVQSDPSDRTVGYTVRYVMESGRENTEQVRLQLQEQGDGYLIANEG